MIITNLQSYASLLQMHKHTNTCLSYSETEIIVSHSSPVIVMSYLFFVLLVTLIRGVSRENCYSFVDNFFMLVFALASGFHVKRHQF